MVMREASLRSDRRREIPVRQTGQPCDRVKRDAARDSCLPTAAPATLPSNPGTSAPFGVGGSPTPSSRP